MIVSVEEEAGELGALVVPAGGGPGVVLVHDVWGLSDHTRDVARRLSAEGFVVLAVDLYRELGDQRIEDPAAFMRRLSDPEMLVRIRLAVDRLGAHPATRGKVGVVGFCMGGMYTLLAGARVPSVSAIAPFYGILSHRQGLLHDEAGLDAARHPDEPLEVAGALGCPVLAFFGDADPYVPIEEIRELERRVRASPHGGEVVVYEGAGHAFFNDTRPAAYRPDAARDAFSRLVRFLRERLA